MGQYRIRRDWNWWVVKFRPGDEGHERGSLRAHSLPHILTPCPEPGDEVIFVLRGSKTQIFQTVAGQIEVSSERVEVERTATIWERRGDDAALEPVRYTARIRPAAAVSIDDTWQPTFADILIEALDGADWRYCGCDCQLVEEETSPLKFERLSTGEWAEIYES